MEGKTVDEAAQILHAAGITGTVEYLFLRDAVFQEAIAASDEMVEMHEAAKAAGREMRMPNISAKVVMQVLFARECSMEAFQSLPFKNRMRQLASVGTASETTDEATGKRSGKGTDCKIWSIFGSPELKRDLKV